MKTLFALFILSSGAWAQVTVMTADNREIQARELKIVTLQGRLCVEYDGQTLRCADVVEIAFRKFNPRTAFGNNDLIVTLTSQDVVFGTVQPASTAGDFQIRTSAFGNIDLKFDQVHSIRFPVNSNPSPKKEPPFSGKSDIFLKKSGDLGEGSILSLDDKQVVYDSPIVKKQVKVPLEGMVYLRLLPPAGKPPAAPATLFSILTTTDGSSVQGVITGLKDGVLEFKDLYDVTRKVPAGLLSSIYFKNGRVVYLSDLKPVKADENANYVTAEKPLPSDLSWPWQADRSVKGAKLAIKGREFRKGIGVHAYSLLTFDLSGDYKRFQTSAGFDNAALPNATAFFEVWVDGQKKNADLQMKAGDAAADLDIDVTGAKELRLVVNWGPLGEPGACADWGSARLIK